MKSNIGEFKILKGILSSLFILKQVKERKKKENRKAFYQNRKGKFLDISVHNDTLKVESKNFL